MKLKGHTNLPLKKILDSDQPKIDLENERDLMILLKRVNAPPKKDYRRIIVYK